MTNNIADIAIQEFQQNEQNFFMRLRQIIVDDESPLDATSKIQVYYNAHEDGFIYFKFNVETVRTHYNSDYYRSDYDFETGQKNNIDELISSEKDIELFVFLGTKLKKSK